MSVYLVNQTSIFSSSSSVVTQDPKFWSRQSWRVWSRSSAGGRCARPSRARTECCKVPSAMVRYLVPYLHCIYTVSYLLGYTLFFVVHCQFLGFFLVGHNTMQCVMHVKWQPSSAHCKLWANQGVAASANFRENWTLISAHLSSLLRKSATWDNPTIRHVRLDWQCLFFSIQIKDP